MYDAFWWASALARMDTRDSLANVQVRGTAGSYTTVIPPEEITTFNLVRRLAGRGAAVALHSRFLETASGADLQMAVEIAENHWISLAVQAKRIYTSPSGHYDQLKPAQLDLLRLWAHRNAMLPAAMFYNAEIAPFGRPSPTATVVMGACCQAANRCHGWLWPRWTPPDPRSPLGVTISLLPPVASVTSAGATVPALSLPFTTRGAHASDINPHAMPVECLFCPSLPAVPPTSPTPPAWASTLLSRRASPAAEPEDPFELSPEASDDSEASEPWTEGWVPTLSIVAPFAPPRALEDDARQAKGQR